VVEVRQHCYYLVCMSKGSDERTDRVGASEIIQKIQLVQNSEGTARNVYLLNGNVFWLSPPRMTILIQFL
jgi:hypothetical protein